jgi:hypothetical protein
MKESFMVAAHSNDVPVARLTGLKQKKLRMDAPLSHWRGDDSMPIPWGRCTGILCDVADAAMGIAFASTLARRANSSPPLN